jgi:hypothetical protein
MPRSEIRDSATVSPSPNTPASLRGRAAAVATLPCLHAGAADATHEGKALTSLRSSGRRGVGSPRGMRHANGWPGFGFEQA